MPRQSTLLSYIWRCSCVLNLAAIIYLTGVTWLTTLRICRAGAARAFLNGLSTLPPAPWFMPTAALSGYALLLAAFCYRRRTQRHEPAVCTVEVALCVWITLVMRMSYKGVVLLVLADLMLYLRSWRKRGYFLALMVALYVVADASLAQILHPMVTFEDFAAFYPAQQAGLLLGVRNLLTSASIIFFVIFGTVLLQQQSVETRRIRRLNAQLAQANEQLRALTVERERMARMRERNRLAREIHDTLGHALTGISVGLDACRALLDVSPEAARRQLSLVSDAARRGLADVRASVGALRAEDDAPAVPITETLDSLIAGAASASGAQITAEIDLSAVLLTADEQNAVTRLVQEGITNALRHGGATCITIHAAPDAAHCTLALRVSDNGRGCECIVPNFGLRHMKERFALLGGWVKFDGTDGFMIEAGLPLRREEDTHDPGIDRG